MAISSSFQHLHVTLLRRATTKNCLQPPREVFAAHRHMRKKINTHISHSWLLNTSYHLEMRKFPSHSVRKGGRGLRGNSARPDVTLLWWHIPDLDRLSVSLLSMGYSQQTSRALPAVLSTPNTGCRGSMGRWGLSSNIVCGTDCGVPRPAQNGPR